MRIIVIVLLGLAFASVVLLWLFKNSKEKIRFPYIVSSVLIVTVACLGWFEARWQHHEQVATVQTVAISDNPLAEVHCQRMSEALIDVMNATKGMVYYSNPNIANLKYDTCSALFSWIDSDKTSYSKEQATALAVLTHEAEHVKGEFNEGVAECLAMKDLPQVVTSLGGSADIAAQITSTYVNEVHPNLRPEYLNGVC